MTTDEIGDLRLIVAEFVKPMYLVSLFTGQLCVAH